MSKTPFRMPQRSRTAAAEIDQWVAGGEGAVRQRQHHAPSVRPARWRG